MPRFISFYALLVVLLPIFCTSVSHRLCNHRQIILIAVLVPWIGAQETATCSPGSVQDDTGTCTPTPLYDEDDDSLQDVLDDADATPLDGDEDDDVLQDVLDDADEFSNLLDTDHENQEQEVEGSPEEIEGTEEVIRKMEEYFDDEISKSRYDSIRDRCINKDKLCAFWAYTGECERNVEYMHSNCALACRACEQVDQSDENELNDADDTMDFAEVTDSVKQEVVGTAEEVQAIEEVIRKMEEYFDDEISKPMYDSIRHRCINKNKSCALWATTGQCKKNPSFMKLDCALACQACESLADDFFVGFDFTRSSSNIPSDSVEQEVNGSVEQITAVQGILKKMIEYADTELIKSMYDDVRHKCVNKHKLCAFWVTIEECEKNASFMKSDCPLACLACDTN